MTERLDDIKARLDRGILPSPSEARWLVGELEIAQALAGRVTEAALDFARTVAAAAQRRAPEPPRLEEIWDERTGTFFDG